MPPRTLITGLLLLTTLSVLSTAGSWAGEANGKSLDPEILQSGKFRSASFVVW